MMKFYTTLIAVIFTAIMFAQSPEKMSYQAVIRNSSDALVTNTTIGMQISILQGSNSGTAVYVETINPTTNANGLVSIEIGGGAGFNTIDWANGPYFIKTETDPTGGTSYSITGTSQFLSVPYALYSKTSGSSLPGPQGLAGLDGANGVAGLDGANGIDGATGQMGEQGPVGLDGANGAAGLDGSNGIDGATGQMGEQGPVGLDGSNGIDGATGQMGEQGPAGLDGANASQNIEKVLIVGNNANGEDLVNTGKIGIGTASPNAASSMEIATPLPVIFPSMTQTEINAITPVEGMVQFNTNAHKLQVYSMLTTNTSILNEIFMGAEMNNEDVFQNITSPIDGQIVAIELLLKNGPTLTGPLQISCNGQHWTVPEYNSFTWFTMPLDNPINVFAGQNTQLQFYYGFLFTFATNSNYPNGSCQQAGSSTPTSQDDVLFRIHIQPTAGSFGWQNMN